MIAITSSFLKIVMLSLHLSCNLLFNFTLPTSERSYLSDLKKRLLKISLATSKEGGSPGLKTL